MRDALREKDLAEAARVPDCVVDIDQAGRAMISLPVDGLDRILADFPLRDREHYRQSSANYDGLDFQ